MDTTEGMGAVMGYTFAGETHSAPVSDDDKARCRRDALITTGHTVIDESPTTAIVLQYGGAKVRWRKESGKGADAMFVREGEVT